MYKKISQLFSIIYKFCNLRVLFGNGENYIDQDNIVIIDFYLFGNILYINYKIFNILYQVKTECSRFYDAILLKMINT